MYSAVLLSPAAGKFVERGEPFNAIGPHAEQMPHGNTFARIIDG